MARKPRPDPITQGSYREIYEKFFGPLIQYKPPHYSIKDWLEELFHFRHRDIVRYVAKRSFTLPGLYYLAPLMPVQGIGFRSVKEGDELFVRTDARTPDVVDVEFHGGQGGKEQVFRLTASEWGWTKLRLEEAERVRKGKK